MPDEYRCNDCGSYDVEIDDERIFKFGCNDCGHRWCLDQKEIIEYRKILKTAPAIEERH